MTENNKTITGAEALLRSLSAEGVETVFGYPGGSIIPIYDTLYDYKNNLTHILTRHEQGAVHAAEGYARATGKVGVCFATSGPGATNLITGIADAMIDSTPIVCITAQVSAAQLGSDAFQEADMISMTMPVTKWSYQITDASEVAEAVAKAFYIAANGRPGPVVLDFTKNAQIQAIEHFDYKSCEAILSYRPYPELDIASIDAAAELINSSVSPLLIVGQGVKLSSAEKELITLAEKAGIPMASTLMGLSAVPTSHPLYVGKVGMHGNIAPNTMTQESDLIIAVGMRFSDRVTGDIAKYATKAKVIHIDIDKAELGKVIQPTVAINADAKAALYAIIERVKDNSHNEWLEFGHERYDYEYRKVIKESLTPTSDEIGMGEVVNIIAENASKDAIIVTDVGQQQMFSSRYSKFSCTRSFITSGGLGTMGFGLPAAIGAKMGCPEREVILIVGDGGFQMTMQELGTIMQNDINVKVVILNNSFLGMVRQWQQLFFHKRYSFTELENPDFEMIAKAYGIASRKVSERENLKEAVLEMLNSDRHYLLDVTVCRQENIFPMVPAGGSIGAAKVNEY